MAGTRNLFASMSGIALLGAPVAAHGSQPQAANVMGPPAPTAVAVVKWSDGSRPAAPSFVSGRIKVSPKLFKGAGCGALFLKIDVPGRPPEFARAKGNPATGACFYAFRTAPIKGPTQAAIYMKFSGVESFQWGALRPIELAPGKHVVSNGIYMKF